MITSRPYFLLACFITCLGFLSAETYSAGLQEQESTVFNGVNTPQISNLNIKAFCQDSLGYMWIATPRGLNRFNGYEFVQYFHDKNDSLSLSSDFIYSLFIDSSHRLWIGTSKGIDSYDFFTNRFTRYASPKTIYAYSFFEDHNHRIWAATHIGPAVMDTAIHKVILHLDTDGKFRSTNLMWEDDAGKKWLGLNDSKGLVFCKADLVWEYFTLPSDRWVTCMFSDQQGVWWLGTNAGLVLFDPERRTFKEAPVPCMENSLLHHSHIHFIKEISPLKLLIGTASQGAFMYDIPSQTLTHGNFQNGLNIASKQLLSCYIDRQGIVWIGSFDQGFSTWSRYSGYFNPDRMLSEALKGKFVTRVAEDNSGGLWISTRYDGLFYYSASKKLTVYNHANSKLFDDISNPLIETLFVDSQNRIWIGFSKELIVGDIKPDGQIVIRDRKAVNSISDIAEDTHGNIWIGTTRELYKVNKDVPPGDLKLVHRAHVPDICVLSSGDILFLSYGDGIYRIQDRDGTIGRVEIPLAEADVVLKNSISLFEDSQHRIWAGSYGEGMLCLQQNNECRVFTRDDGLPSNDVLGFNEDEQGTVWISTSYGIARMRSTGSGFVNYFSNDGTLGNQFHERAVFKHSDGRIFFGGNHGLTFFNPLIVLPNKYPPSIHLEDLKIWNQSVIPAGKGSVLKQTIAFTRHITLNHKHTTVSFDYAGIDFHAPQKLTYSYKLEGFDKKWNEVGTYRRATYSNLAPGNYTFMVKAINGDGIESVHPATLHITVKPAPQFSWPAWLLYFVILAGGAVLLFRLWFKIKMSRQQLEIEHKERGREREIAEMKMTFFTNISHELRTPLTLISAPLEQLMSREYIAPADQSLFAIISRNIQRLLRLMNQLLDFRKMEAGMLSLKVAQLDLIQAVRNVKTFFEYYADEKQIGLSLEAQEEKTVMPIDQDKFEKILHNLLSNALKHTPPDGTVKITVAKLPFNDALVLYPIPEDAPCDYMEISVVDSGPGVHPDKMNELFVRYRQLDSSVRPDYAGTGIGLHYTKRLVEAHKGFIRAQIPAEGGMMFSLILPFDPDRYLDEEKDTVQTGLYTGIHQDIDPGIVDVEDTTKHQYTVLVAEDNLELMAFLRSLLGKDYELLEAADGDKAWALAQNEVPDLIVTDVLMPGMTGYQLCAHVKNHPGLSHIPVIMLTAKSTENDQLEGLEQGADAYICKPFNVSYLLLTMKNMLHSREKLRNYYLHPQAEKKEDIPVKLSFLDQQFMNKLTQLIQRELSNTELDINTLARELGFSRTNLYRKLKGLTNMSPVDFLRNYRLRCAAEMILNDAGSLFDIADKTGFATYSYFSASFKKQFGVSPKDYKLYAK